jgi:hypothetical protein
LEDPHGAGRDCAGAAIANTSTNSRVFMAVIPRSLL